MPAEITWYRYGHENRNDLLRFGLMDLHIKGEIIYSEKPLSFATEGGFSNQIARGIHKGLSFLLYKNLGTKKKVIVDSEDSFVFTSEHLQESDIYFCSGYNSDFFVKQQFPEVYDWQNENDLNWYKKTIDKKISTLGTHFYKVNKFVPIGPNLVFDLKRKFVSQKLLNIRNRLYFSLNKKTRWVEVYHSFILRYNYLKSLREQSLLYDITLHDSLWGWPRHRLNLHYRLAEIASKGYNVNSVLKWSEPKISDGSINDIFLKESNFPILSGAKITNYERMLASSKLGVFATGFHWGWRNIMMFCLMTGVPVLTDKLILCPWFDMKEFIIFENRDHDWKSLQGVLEGITPAQLAHYKKHNQQFYDEVMSPEAVGRYFLNTIYLKS